MPRPSSSSNENQSPRRAEVTLAVATVFISTCLAAVTSVAVALAGQLADRLLRRSIDPYRRAYLLAGFANSIPVVLPFSAFSLITLSAASGARRPVPHAVFFDDGNVLSHCAFRRILRIDRYRHRTS